ncbi:MAG: hypothetical protein QXG86_01720 [Candidatus Woesearchaeota archaeon]
MYKLQGIEEKLSKIDLPIKKEIIKIKKSDIVEYQIKCNKIRKEIENQEPNIVLCKVPESYSLGKILYKAGIKNIKMLPEINKNNIKHLYNSIREIVNSQQKNSLSVAFLNCEKTINNTSFFSALELFITAVEEKISESPWREYFFLCCSYSMRENVSDQKIEEEIKILGFNENEERAILYENIRINEFGVHNLFNGLEFNGVIDKNGIVRVKNKSQISIINEDNKIFKVGEKDTHKFFVENITNYLIFNF